MRKVEIIWMFRGRFRKEQCELFDPEDPFVDADGDIVDDLTREQIIKDGFVYFKDAEGPFFLHANQIHSIRVLEDHGGHPSQHSANE